MEQTANPGSALERFFDLVGADEPDASQANLYAFARLLSLGLVVELAAKPEMSTGLLVGMAIAGAAVWFPQAPRKALWFFTGLFAFNLLFLFPVIANHHYLSFGLLLVLSGFRWDVEEDRRIALQTLRWAVIVGILWAGVQKIWYGYYMHGEALAFFTAVHERFAVFFQYLMPAGEFARIRSLDLSVGAGPYRVDSFAFTLLSHVTYLGEILLPLLLLVPRVRTLAAIALLLLFAGIEAGARELFFGLLMTALLLTFWPNGLLRRALPIFVLVYVYLLLARLGVLPGGSFS